ncbi:MAG: hypothetical protein RL071_1426 [Pseudomonadota bacterium]
MKAHQAQHKISMMARVLELSRSGYYAWLARSPSDRSKDEVKLMAAVANQHRLSRGIYGAPRIHAALREAGTRVGRKRVARLMRAAGLSGVTRRRRRSTTSRDPASRPAPDLVNRKFTADQPDQLWVADITHVPTRAGALYLATVMDVWSRKIVGWALDEAMPAELVARALEKACAARRPKRVIHHSDQGSQYTSALFSKRCAEHGVLQSMGTVGDCYDNAMAESFFATLEVELFGAVGVFRSHDDAQQQIFTYIEGFYNTQRRHSALGYRSPQRFEADAQKSRVIHSKAGVISLPPGPPSLSASDLVPPPTSQATMG